MHQVAGASGRVLLPVALVMAAYLVWAGSDLPGGAFQAGTVLAGGLMLAAMGGAIGLPRSDRPLLRAALVLGPLVFLAIGLGGIAAGGTGIIRRVAMWDNCVREQLSYLTRPQRSFGVPWLSIASTGRSSRCCRKMGA